MPRIAAFLLFFLSIALSPGFAAETIKLLTIGNSFADDSTFYLRDIAKASGKEVILFRANLGGHSLKQHADYLKAYEANPNDPKGQNGRVYRGPGKEKLSLVEALQSDAWDYVTIQQVSTQSFQPETFEPYATTLIEAVRKYAPHAQIVIHETWAYREDHSLFKKDNFTQQKMYDGLHAAYQQLAARHHLKIIPVGSAFQKVRTLDRWKYRPDTAFDFANAQHPALPNDKGGLNAGWKWSKNRNTGRLTLGTDSKHANIPGRYLGATLFYNFLFPDGPESSFTPPGLNKEEAADLRQVAKETIDTRQLAAKP